jgi:tetratricopeptide (TPR) repeat protein
MSDGALERAAAALDQHLKIFPSDSSARWLLGVVYLSMGKTTCATEAWRQIGDERAVAGRLYALGMSAAQSGDRDAAETWYLAALEVDPTHVDLLYTLGGFYWAQDRNRAVEYLQLTVQVDGEPSARWHMALGQIHYAASNWDAAIAAFEDALLLDPEWAEAYHFLGGALRQRGDLSGAIQALNKAIMLDDQHFWSYVLLGQIRLEQGRYDLAIRQLEEASMISPQDALVHALLGQAFRHAGELQLAIAEFQLASALDKSNVSYHLQLGMLYQATGDVSEAAGEYQAVLVLAPGNSYATQRLRESREQ